MRCLSCNCVLGDYDSTRKFAHSGEYVDLCTDCLIKSEMTDIPMITRPDLLGEVNEEIEEDNPFFSDVHD